MTWKRADRNGLDKKLEWKIKCLLQYSHPEMRTVWEKEERLKRQRKNGKEKESLKVTRRGVGVAEVVTCI